MEQNIEIMTVLFFIKVLAFEKKIMTILWYMYISRSFVEIKKVRWSMTLIKCRQNAALTL